jgi:hypothetical protein
MSHFIKKNNVSIEPPGKSFLVSYRSGFYFFEIPSKYSDAYRSTYGKMGPGIKLLIWGLGLWFLFWLAKVADIILGFMN